MPNNYKEPKDDKEIGSVAILGGFQEMLCHLGQQLINKLESEKLTDEEFAFLLGNLNVVTALSATKTTGKIACCKISLDYKDIKKDFLEFMKAVTPESCKEPEKEHQVSLDDIFPGIFDEMDKRIEKAVKNANKNPKPKDKK